MDLGRDPVRFSQLMTAKYVRQFLSPRPSSGSPSEPSVGHQQKSVGHVWHVRHILQGQGFGKSC